MDGVFILCYQGGSFYIPVNFCYMYIGKNDEQKNEHNYQQQHNNEPAVFFYHK
jgi:hypothetical protein